MIRAKLALTPERWERIKQIFEAAVNLPSEERLPFASRLCNGDSQLESEVRNLLSADDRAGSFLNIPAAAAIGCASSTFQSSLLGPGTVLGHRFEIIRFVNSGGMGDVYEAQDAELQENVALKTIRPVIASNADIIDRFKREVRQSRGISHPNICRVYDLFSDDNAASGRTWFLTMQLLRGETLQERLRRDGPFPPAQALDLVRQMVAGLAAAHELGIVHGDFKSGNVMLVAAERERLQVVITDFGLALNLGAQRVDGQDTAREGTPAYMAPEQWRGERVGVAVDQYAAGIVICEMLSGRRPEPVERDGAHGGQVRLPSDSHIPLRWQGVLRRCLQPDPVDRFANVNDLLAALDPRVRLQKRRRIAAVVAMLVIVCAIVFAIAASAPDTRLENLKQITASTDLSASPSLSHDGKMIAYESDREESDNLDIYVQRLPSGNALRLTDHPTEEGDPDISPDGTQVVYHSDRDGGGVYLASTAGGPERLLAAGGKNPRFSPDGHSIVFWNGDDDITIASGQIYVMSLDSEDKRQLAQNFDDARMPAWSLDGKLILFTGCHSADKPLLACSEWWVTSADGKTESDTGTLKLLREQQIVPIGAPIRFSKTAIVFPGRQEQSATLWELRMERLRSVGRPHALASQDLPDYISSGTFAENGTIAFTELSSSLGLWRIKNYASPSPKLLEASADADMDFCPHASHNGEWLVYVRGLQPQRDILVRNVFSGSESRFSPPEVAQFSPIIDDAGNKIAFEATARATGLPAVFVLKKGQDAVRICNECNNPSDWILDRVVYRSGPRIMIADARADTAPSTLLERPDLVLAEATWSPQNNYLLFTATKNDKKQIYAVQYTPTQKSPIAGTWIPITQTSEWADKPRWSSDGNTIYYVSMRDGFLCVWSQHFNAAKGKPDGTPSLVMDFHHAEKSLSRVTSRSFDIAVARDGIYLDIGKTTGPILTGVLRRNYVLWLLHRFLD